MLIVLSALVEKPLSYIINEDLDIIDYKRTWINEATFNNCISEYKLL